MGELSGSGIGSEVGVKKELIRVVPEKVPFLENTSALIDRHVDFLQKTILPLAEKTGNPYWMILGGDSQISHPVGPSVNYAEFSKKNPYPDIDSKNGFSRVINTGVDVNYLINSYPSDRWKFYLSLDTSNVEKMKKSQSFVRDLVEKCKEKKISLAMKTEDHAYDSPDLYTWQPITMAGILKELYQKPEYVDIWYDTLHFFQRPIKGINEKHIGLVQEPIGGGPGRTSHSERMRCIGDIFDNRLAFSDDKKVNSLLFMGAASSVGVVPSEPWRINPNLLKQNNKK